MKYVPHPFQAVAVEHAVQFFQSASPGDRVFYTAPTGCGKSVVEVGVQERLDGIMIVTPRAEIVDGLLDKGADPDLVWTPVKLRNRLLNGKLPHPKGVIYDEGHHHTAETWQQLDLLSGMAPAAAYSATAYRGSPRSTKQLLDFWGEPVPIITFREAAALGYISVPTFEVLPLVDDDIVEVRGGEFEIESLDGVTVDRLGDAADHARQWYVEGGWDRPTVFSLPSSFSCKELHRELGKRGLPSAVVSAETPRETRRTVFNAVEAGVLALLHINIVSEGVDLKLRRLVDMAPTMSPVRWVQQLGRITRPTDRPPEYVCTNRNLLRHSYALEGCVPTSAVVEAERRFPPTQRAHTRVLGLEAIGRFKPAPVKLLSGANAYVYALSVPVEGVVVEYCALVHPTMEPIWACRVHRQDGDKKKFGTWVACDPPTDVRGFASLGNRAISEKQANWWTRKAASHGLDPDQEPTVKNFQALPMLTDLGLQLQ